MAERRPERGGLGGAPAVVHPAVQLHLLPKLGADESGERRRSDPVLVLVGVLGSERPERPVPGHGAADSAAELEAPEPVLLPRDEIRIAPVGNLVPGVERTARSPVA